MLQTTHRRWLDPLARRWFLLAPLLWVGVVLICMVGNAEVPLWPLFLVPVAFATWTGSLGFGTFFAVSSATVSYWLDTYQGVPYSRPSLLYWAAAARLAYLAVLVLAVARLRSAFRQLGELAHIDPLTRLYNRRGFLNLAQRELARAVRSGWAVSLLYVDVDDFKRVNDLFGHTEGDRVLAHVAAQLRGSRAGDIPGRLGGDEFAVVLPETGPEQARAAAGRIREQLSLEMANHGWEVTFSMGLVTCAPAPASIDGMLARADELAYHVKRARKNGIAHELIQDAFEAGGERSRTRLTAASVANRGDKDAHGSLAAADDRDPHSATVPALRNWRRN